MIRIYSKIENVHVHPEFASSEILAGLRWSRGSTHQGGAGEQEAQDGSKMLGGASVGGPEGLNGASRDSAKELDSMSRGL